MKKAISIILLFTTTSVLAQINLPKLPRIFKKPVAPNGLKVQWSCPQEDYTQVAQLTKESEVTVTVDENGEISYHPNIFKIKPLSKEFFQGLNPIGRKKGTYRVDYEDCLDRFYANISKAHNEYKKDCSSQDKLCEYENRFLTQKSKEAVEGSRYFQKKDNIVLVPRVLPGTSIYVLTKEEALNELRSFCEDDKVQNPTKLLSQSVVGTIQSGAKAYKTEFPGLVCLTKYKKLLNEEVARIQKDNCDDGSKNPACSTAEANAEKIKTSIEQVLTITNQAIASEIKNLEYRYGKTVDGKIVDEYFQNTFKIPEGNCGYNYADIGDNKNVNLIRYDEAISNNLDSIFSQGSLDCQKQFLQNYVASKHSILNNDEYFTNFCKLHEIEYCKKIIGEKDLVSQNIKKMIEKIYGDLGERYVQEQLACVDETESSLTDILNKVKDSQKVIRCMDVKKGDYVTVSTSMNYEIRTGDYTLKNLGDNKYEAYFNIEFQDNPEAKTTAKELMERTQKCMETVSPFLKGPDGEQLTIKVVNQENGLEELPRQQRPRKTNIGIAASGFRSHSLKYEENISCPVITHEVLHLFGLCDEYEEKWQKDGQNYNCRSVPKAVSVMKNQNEMFDIAVDKELSCDCSGKNCKDVMNGDDEEKKKLFLSKSIFEAIPYQNRSDFCTLKDLPSQKYINLKNKDKNLLLLSDAENRLVIEGREFDYGSPNQVNRVTFNCECSPEDSRCLEFLDSARDTVEKSDQQVRGSCPAGSRQLSSGIGNSEKSSVNYNPETGVLGITQKAKAPSLLHPAHFERILGGACEEKGKKYLECAKFAYKNGECDVPEYCKDDSAYLGIKQ